MSFFVLCCNVALLAVGAVRDSGYSEGGVADPLQDDDALVSRWNTALHVLVDTLSSMLLAGRNYTMQVISSPIREEFDRAYCQETGLLLGY
jgi:hypothetical protein